jgi:2-C-methyl-D-erythritol 2,4-cyclodiphosphate synthase
MRKSTIAFLWVLGFLFLGAYTIPAFLLPTRKKTGDMRIGHSYDIHQMRPMPNSKKPLIIGGVQISDQHYVEAHSDGDVIFHALTDALLGAAGLPDIGELFSDQDRRWKDMSSSVFLQNVLSEVKKAGYRLISADVTLVLQKPKFAPFKNLVIRNLKELLEIDAVNVKARTHEHLDAVGEGRAVSCHAVVLLDRL